METTFINGLKHKIPMQKNEVNINYALLRKSKAYQLKEKAEDDILRQIAFKSDRAILQKSKRHRKRKAVL